MEIKNELWENQGEKSICKKAMWTEIFSIPRENLAGASTKSAVGKHCKGQNGKYIKQIINVIFKTVSFCCT